MCQPEWTLAAREWGDGDRVAVLIHGMAGDGGDWAPVAPLIAARGYRVVAVDLPGHGRSPAMSGATFERLAGSVAEAAGAEPAERTPRAPETAAWDVETTADAWVGVAGQDLTPPALDVPSLLVRAEPSSYATPEVVRDLAARRFTFVDALGDWL